MSKNKLSKRQENQIQYLSKILAAIQDGVFEEESNNHIDIKDFGDSDKLKDFIHVIATAVPCQIYGQITGDDKNHLEFNHLANQLCFENLKLTE